MPGTFSGETLLPELRLHFAAVLEIYERVVHSKAVPLRLALEPQTGPRAHWEHFLERAGAAVRERLNHDPSLATNALDLFQHSPYFAEELIRMPELLDDMEQASTPLSERVALPAEISDLRLWYRRAMIRIQSDSVCLRRPIFETLGDRKSTRLNSSH